MAPTSLFGPHPRRRPPSGVWRSASITIPAQTVCRIQSLVCNLGRGLGFHQTCSAGGPQDPVLADRPPRVQPAGRGLCVLAFDGGGFRGYASLLMLKRLLRGIVPESKIPVYPYQYFDIICGTGTGGLIAIMLSVLHLDIDTAISCYKRALIREGRQRWWWGQDSRHTLTTAMREALEEHGCVNRLMASPAHDKGCKVRIMYISSPYI
jgi:hypothetical protein